ncbi:MAG TPA: MBL fold metallo-hydrolase [Jiangellales bacterium]|nr:MBL fold metallo-hydrolase [Jiangellales bacterium]
MTDAPSVEILETPNLGDRSYVVHAGGRAAVVDPQRDVDRVLAIVEEHGLTVESVLETHLHNDYVTGGLELARRLRADYVVPALARVGYDRTPAADADAFQVGDLAWRVLHTPGHTPHHVSYAVSLDGTDRAVFTGGSLLLGSVGRPDLVSPELTEGLAHDQWRSARRLVAELDPAADVHPTHGFGSFCSATPTTAEPSTLGEQRRANPALVQDEEDFVRDLLAGLDVYPAYYRYMGPANAEGPPPVDLSPAPTATAEEVARRLAAGEWVVDLRARRVHAAGHLPGSLSFDGSGNVVTYLGWLMPWGSPVTLLGDDPGVLAEVQRDLARIGIDRPASASAGGPAEWAGGRATEVTSVRDFAALAQARDDRDDVSVVDLRRLSEWEESHIDGATPLPLHELPDRLDDLPDGELWAHCESGFRAAVGASLIRRTGREVVLVDDDYEHAADAGLRLVRGES